MLFKSQHIQSCSPIFIRFQKRGWEDMAGVKSQARGATQKQPSLLGCWLAGGPPMQSPAICPPSADGQTQVRPCEPGACGASCPRRTARVTEAEACHNLSPLCPLGEAIRPGLAGPREGYGGGSVRFGFRGPGWSSDPASSQLCDPRPSHSLSVPQFPPLTISLTGIM